MPDILPFNHKNFTLNAEKCSGDMWPCAVCGKPTDTKNPDTKWVVVIQGGSAWGDENSPMDGGHMGGHPVGSVCAKKLLRQGVSLS